MPTPSKKTEFEAALKPVLEDTTQRNEKLRELAKQVYESDNYKDDYQSLVDAVKTVLGKNSKERETAQRVADAMILVKVRNAIDQLEKEVNTPSISNVRFKNIREQELPALSQKMQLRFSKQLSLHWNPLSKRISNLNEFMDKLVKGMDKVLSKAASDVRAAKSDKSNQALETWLSQLAAKSLGSDSKTQEIYQPNLSTQKWIDASVTVGATSSLLDTRVPENDEETERTNAAKVALLTNLKKSGKRSHTDPTHSNSHSQPGSRGAKRGV
jgi:hypothetical protein